MNFDHIVLNVLNMEAMITFYSEIIGLKIEGYKDFQAGKTPFPAARLSDTQFMNLFPPKMWQGDTPVDHHVHMNMNHFCFGMEKSNWEALLTRLEANSITIEDGPNQREGASGVGTAMSFRDPDNNLVEARYYD